MRTINLPTDLLRTFVTVIEVASFTRAAEILGRTQPAVSLQVQRLEQLVGHSLIKREGKNVALTERGEALAAHARQILRLNDIAVSHFKRPDEGTVLRIGLPVDYAVNLLQSIITKVVRSNSDTRIDIFCDLSKNLIESLRRNELDIVVALFEGDDQQFLFRQWSEQPIWVASEKFQVDLNAEIPLVVHPFGCVYRNRMTEALKNSGQGWRIAYSSPGIGGVQKAIINGLGVTCLTGPTVIKGMKKIAPGAKLPVLSPINIGLFARQVQLDAVGYEAIDAIGNGLEAALN